eukprot:TRINITY_DN59205_c0_g1_i1.p1 TRINITY_DN59205_c0_g1~~TRINITY_DN59205_c0_g1_i1.p1  ORF type:complete len:103 (-),score=4.19 TRINITY_DN59205_c0_g1_i1:16-324(-)
MPRELVDALIGVCIPPILVYQRKKVGSELIINILLWICISPLAILHAFHVDGMEPLVNVLCLCIPPAGYYVSKKQLDGDFWICLILWIFIPFLAAFWAYHKA